MEVSPTQGLSPSRLSSSATLGSKPELSTSASAAASTVDGKDWIYRLEEHSGMKNTVLGRMVRDMQTTFRVMGRALQVAGKKSLENIGNTPALAKPAAVIVAMMANLLYGGSLLTLTLIKSVIWIPMISFTCVAGGLGAMLGGALEGMGLKGAAQGTLDVFGYIGKLIGGLAGFVVFVPSATLQFVGRLGAALIQPNVFSPCWDPYTEVDAKLLKALSQANPSGVPVLDKPLLLQFCEHALSKGENLTNYFRWLGELGVDFNETMWFGDKQHLLLLIHKSYVENRASEFWDKKWVAYIKNSLEKAGVWEKLFPENQKAIDLAIQNGPEPRDEDVW